MSSELNNPHKDNQSEEDADQLLARFVNQKFDLELRKMLSSSLEKNYLISKSHTNMNTLKQKKSWSVVGVIAAAVLLTLLALNPLYDFKSALAADDPPPFPKNIQALAYNYLEEVDIQHGGILKGQTEEEMTRTNAINAFNAKDFKLAEEYFSVIESKSEEDQFYAGVAALYNKHYPASIQTLKQIVADGSLYQTEAGWYLALAYILNGNNAAAVPHLEHVLQSNWNVDLANQLLENIKAQ